MKIINSLLLLFLLAGIGSAQAVSNPPESTPRDAPGLTVIEKKWSKQVRNPLLEQDPMRASAEALELQRARQQNQRDNSIRASLGLPPLPPPMAGPRTMSGEREARPGRPTVEYIYRAKVNNTGSKAIRKMVWEYVFFDPATQKEVGRRRYENKVNIRPGKSSNVIARSLTPPTGTIDANQVGKQPKDQYSEQIVIQRIEYADGSVWLRP
jgi:hypothetical protein